MVAAPDVSRMASAGCVASLLLSVCCARRFRFLVPSSGFFSSSFFPIFFTFLFFFFLVLQLFLSYILFF